MPDPRRLTSSALAGVAAAATLACGLGGLVSSAGLRDVVIEFQGDTVLPVGVSRPFRITVRAEGEVLVAPRLALTIADTSVVVLTAGGDSLLGRKAGSRTELIVRLLTSVATDSTPTLAQGLRVTGGPGSP
ncbi:MAG TPA: hypothetical protein VNI61_00550 [Gemmatimonadales bacterium]|nr:hypothetical protein [Gemmatimonadales bacterium]